MPADIDAGRRRVSLNPRDPEFFQNPYPAYAAIHDAAPVFYWEQYGYWCFARHADVSALLRDKRFGRQILHVTSREALGWDEPPAHLDAFNAIERHSLLELEPPEHTRLRGLINRAFVSRQVERLAPRIAELAHEAIDRVEFDGETDLMTAFATPIPVAVISEMIGTPLDAAPKLLDWSHRMVAMYQFGVTRAVEDSAAAASAEFATYIRAAIAERRRAPRDDLISRLIEAEAEGGKLTEDEMVTTCVLLLNAGHEATVHAFGNGVKAWLENGVESPIDDAAVEELLRYDTPLHLFTRYALQDVEIAGVRLRQGDRIGLLLGAANRDPAIFSDPDLFDASRLSNPHVSFGAGVHFCVGAPLARLELRVALPILRARLPGLRLAEAPRYRDAYHFHGLESLCLRWRGSPDA